MVDATPLPLWERADEAVSATEALDRVKELLELNPDASLREAVGGSMGVALVQMLLAPSSAGRLEHYVHADSSCSEWSHWLSTIAANDETHSEIQARVRLRPIRDDDIDALYDAALQPAGSFRWRFKGVTPTRETFYQLLYAGTASQFIVEGALDRERFGLVAAYDHRPDIGVLSIAFQRISVRPPGGETFEGMFHFIEYLFASMPLRKIYAEVPGYNEELLGLGAVVPFREEGRFSDHDFYGGRWWPRIWFALRRSDWDSFASPLRESLGAVPSGASGAQGKVRRA